MITLRDASLDPFAVVHVQGEVEEDSVENEGGTKVGTVGAVKRTLWMSVNPVNNFQILFSGRP